MNGDIKTKTIPIYQETTWLVHQTDIFPEDGILHPAPVPAELTTTGYDTSLPPSVQYQISHHHFEGFSALANSLHWTANCLAYPREIPLSKDEPTPKNYHYCVIEPLKAFSGKKLRGNSQDVFHLGSHRLSAESFILVPASDASSSKMKEFYAGTIETYDGSLRKKIESFLDKKGAPIIYPSMEGFAITDYFWDDLDQQLILNNVSYSSHVVSQALGLDNTLYNLLPLFDLEKECGSVTACVTAAFIHDQHRKKLVRENFEKRYCSACKKKSSTLKKSLFHCEKCFQAIYCSQNCQTDDWVSHKPLCNQLVRLNQAIQNNHNEYLNLLAKFPYIILRDQVLELLEQIDQEYSQGREKKFLTHYKNYLLTLLDHLFSQTAFYERLRDSHVIKTEQGFISFVTFVKEKVAPFTPGLKEEVS